jgi:hypothetical protein
VLESKADMQKRGQSSPDDGDALALTFAQRSYSGVSLSVGRRSRQAETGTDRTSGSNRTTYDAQSWQ